VTERKPPGVRWESFVERQIRQAQERGEFEDLPSAGKPIADLNDQDEELWWVRRKLREEKVSYLPPSLALRKERDDALDRIAAAKSETVVREIVEELNTKILDANRKPLEGPPSSLMPLDVERVVRQWRDHASSPDRSGDPP
jgi:hypothetical protein